MYKEFYLFRHGETDWNKSRKLQGHNDIPLNSKGVQQAESLIDIVSSFDLEIIHSSDLKRALMTAETLHSNLNIPLLESENLRESSFGEAEGLTYDAIVEKYGEELWEKLRGPNPKDNHSAFPGGESPADVHKRVMGHLNEIANNSDYQRIGISTHGGVLRNIIHAMIPNEQIPIPIPNCVVYLLHYNKDGKVWSFKGQVSPKDNGNSKNFGLF